MYKVHPRRIVSSLLVLALSVTLLQAIPVAFPKLGIEKANANVCPTATGSTVVSSDSTTCVLRFEGNGSFTFPAGSPSVEFTVVGGGGGGGTGRGGGGGGGGVINGTLPSQTASSTISIVVGAGGASATNGGNSSIANGSSYLVEAGGGGSGGVGGSSGNGRNGSSATQGATFAIGGNGGGASFNYTNLYWAGGAGGGGNTAGNSTYYGGRSYVCSGGNATGTADQLRRWQNNDRTRTTGGGGGAGADARGYSPGSGADCQFNDFSPYADLTFVAGNANGGAGKTVNGVTYGGGGGGANGRGGGAQSEFDYYYTYAAGAGTGGSGGGGVGQYADVSNNNTPSTTAGLNGTANTGGGGGGAVNGSGGAGGSGVVILKFTYSTYTVTYAPGTNGSGSIASQSFVAGNSVTLKGVGDGISRSGYALSGWATSDGGSKVYDLGFTYSNLANTTLYPVWTANTNNAITYDNQSATTAQSGGSTLYTSGSPITTIPTTAPLKTGYTFGGWWTQVSGGGTQVTDGSYTPSPGGVTLYAKWTANTYTVTYNYNSATGGNTTTSASFTTGGTAITLPTPTKTYYTFLGWYADSGFSTSIGSAGASYSPNGTTLNITLYAKWRINQFVYYYNLSTDPGHINAYDYSIGTTHLAVSNGYNNTGYKINAGWCTTATTLGGSCSGTLYLENDPLPALTSGDLILYAYWPVQTYAISVTQTSNGTIAPSTTNVNHNGSQTFTFTPNTG